LLEQVVREAREAGACGVWANLLNLRPGTREHFLSALADDYPDQLPAYERLYARRAYLSAGDTRPIRELVSELTRKHAIRDRRRTRLEPEPEPEPEQLALSV
jgi:DNA repair photolyase